ncbi:MAG: tetratricopeptide repeat protein [Proteobacteria bacterium]|nr:tetratricopeptide repeat protein [Pseudomonadota bacterium]
MVHRSEKPNDSSSCSSLVVAGSSFCASLLSLIRLQIVTLLFFIFLDDRTVYATQDIAGSKFENEHFLAQANTKSIRPPSQVRTQKKPVPQSATQVSKQKVNLYVKARLWFEAGNYEKAIQYAAADIRRNPNRKSSYIVMAQAYYRLGRNARAAQIFSKLSLEDITADAALEYTLANYAARKYKNAALGWQRVAEENPNRDIAKFYSGLSYMHLKQYQRASFLLRSAKRLPANLKSERRHLIDDVDALMDRERNGQFSQDQAYAYHAQPRFTPYQPPPPIQPKQPVYPTPPTAPGSTPEKAKQPEAKPPPAAPPAPPQTGWAFSSSAVVTYESLAESVDYNGYQKVVTNKKIPTASLPSSMKYSAKPRSFGGQPYFTLNINPGYDHFDSDVNTSALFAPADDQNAVQTTSSKSEAFGHNQTLKLSK